MCCRLNLDCYQFLLLEGKGKDSLIDLEDSSEANDKLSSKFSGLCKYTTED